MAGTNVQEVFDGLLRREQRTTLEQYLAAQRADGRSYEWIARDLERITRVGTVSASTIRRWSLALEQEAA